MSAKQGNNGDIARKIEATRKALGWTQEQMAERLGTSTGTVNRWEAGTHTPHRKTREAILALAQAAGLGLPGEARTTPQQGHAIESGLRRAMMAIMGETISYDVFCCFALLLALKRWFDLHDEQTKMTKTSAGSEMDRASDELPEKDWWQTICKFSETNSPSPQANIRSALESVFPNWKIKHFLDTMARVPQDRWLGGIRALSEPQCRLGDMDISSGQLWRIYDSLRIEALSMSPEQTEAWSAQRERPAHRDIAHLLGRMLNPPPVARCVDLDCVSEIFLVALFHVLQENHPGSEVKLLEGKALSWEDQMASDVGCFLCGIEARVLPPTRSYPLNHPAEIVVATEKSFMKAMRAIGLHDVDSHNSDPSHDEAPRQQDPRDFPMLPGIEDTRAEHGRSETRNLRPSGGRIWPQDTNATPATLGGDETGPRDGRAAIFVDLSKLRDLPAGNETNKKAFLLERDIIAGVVRFSPDMLGASGEPRVVVLVDRQKNLVFMEKIGFVNVTLDPQGGISEEASRRLTATFLRGESKPGEIRFVSRDELAEAGGNLDPDYWLKGHERTRPPLGALLREVENLEQEERVAERLMPRLRASVAQQPAKPDRLRQTTLGRCVLRIDAGQAKHANPAQVEAGILTLQDLLEGDIDWSRIEQNAQARTMPEGTGLAPGDLIVVASGPRAGEVFLLGQCLPVGFSSRLIRVRTNPAQLVPGYLYYYSKAEAFQQYIRQHKTTYGKIQAGELESLPITLPPLPQQRQIVALLDEVAQKIALAGRRQEAIKNLQQGLLRGLAEGTLAIHPPGEASR